MLDRHLRPDEIDLLLDTEVGFGVQPLRAHVRECASCRAELEQARDFLLVLEDLPHFVPSSDFASRVMSQVQVFEPWHVAARNSVMRFVPDTAPARAAAALAAAASATVVISGSIWAVNRADMGLLLANVGMDEARMAADAAMSDIILAAVGEVGLEAWAAGGPMVVVTAGAGFLLAAGLCMAGLRALTTARHN